MLKNQINPVQCNMCCDATCVVMQCVFYTIGIEPAETNIRTIKVGFSRLNLRCFE